MIKKVDFILVFVLLCSFSLLQAQEEKDENEKKSKISFTTYGGIGFAKVKNDNEPDYNLNSNGGDVLLSYKISKSYSIATGFGFNELSGNGFNSLGSFYHERSMFRIPLLAVVDYNISGKFNMIANVGFYAQNIMGDEYQFLNTTLKDVYTGWNFGTQINFALVFEVSKNFNAGVNFGSQYDFTQVEANNQGINDKQKIESVNSVGIFFSFNL